MAVTIASYLIERLASLGARHLFGVPGNYTAQFLAAAAKDGRLGYVGTTNELEAGYAADALARVERIGVVTVTYGVGSFSLYNAIAGAYVERCPVVVVNGTANARKRDQFLRQGVLFAHAIDPLRTDEARFPCRPEEVDGDGEGAADQSVEQPVGHGGDLRQLDECQEKHDV